MRAPPPRRLRDRIARAPLILHLAGGFAALMLLPAGQALALGQGALAAIFAQGAAGLALLVMMLVLAVPPARRSRQAAEVLVTLALAVTVLPAALALPLARALPDTGLFNAWWEVISCLTTTGASLYAAPALAEPLHLWRGLVGWAGGLAMLTAATALLAPLGVGGFELTASGSVRRPAGITLAARAGGVLAALAPLYAGLTVALWMALMASGSGMFDAAMRAMGTISTSGIAAGGAGPARVGEAAILLFLIPALSRRFWPGGSPLTLTRRRRDDPELRLAAMVVGAVVAVLMARTLIVELETGAGGARSLRDGAAAAWGAGFNALSFLTTTGWTSASWAHAQTWSGLTSPGLLLAGLAIMGGGVATTAGGVKLLRVHALALHSAREMDRIVHPASVAGGGAATRHLRAQGARLAFLVFMLFALSVTAVVLALSVGQIAFETAVMLAVSALTNTGPLASTLPLATALEGTAGAAGAPWQGWAGLSDGGKAVLAVAMIVGRFETLALLAMLSPGFWRR